MRHLKQVSICIELSGLPRTFEGSGANEKVWALMTSLYTCKLKNEKSGPLEKRILLIRSKNLHLSKGILSKIKLRIFKTLLQNNFIAFRAPLRFGPGVICPSCHPLLGVPESYTYEDSIKALFVKCFDISLHQ